MSEFDATGQAPVDAGTPIADTGTPPAAPAGTPAPVQEYEVKVDGQTLKVPLDELLKGYSRNSDYTRKAQALAQERQQIAAYREHIVRAQQMLQDPQLVEAHLRQLRGNQQGQPQVAEDELVTAAQMRQELQRQQQMISQELSRIEIARLTNQFQGQIESQLDRIMGTYPDLEKSVPNAKGILRAIAKAREPQSLQEAIAIMEDNAATINQHVTGFVDGRLKSAGSPAPSQLTNGIEPPNATAPGASPVPIRKLGSPQLRNEVMADLQRIWGNNS